jgi:hypothetical protein
MAGLRGGSSRMLLPADLLSAYSVVPSPTSDGCYDASRRACGSCLRRGWPMRRVVLSIALVCFAFVPLMASPPAAAAARCIRLVGSQFNAPGDDNQNLNAEWVRIKNHCAAEKPLSGWKIHDFNRNHTYTFLSAARIGAGKTVTLFTGRGDDTKAKKFWDKSGAVWNNEPPEKAYLRKPDGTLVSTWTED